MKKKIVYISGADVFDVNDVRAAFEEVRNTLKLGPDTLLFGVPVDDAESIGNSSNTIETDTVEPMPVEIATAPAVNVTDIPVMEIESDDAEIDDATSCGPDVIETVENPEPDAPVVPILSVLASQEENAPEDTEVVAPIPETKVESKVVKSEKVVLDDAEPDIADMINDDIPPESSEKTLEELLETMTPLQEDMVSPRKKKTAKTEPVADPADEIDATLENLASEFAENQDKVASPKKGSERGKIGKLKNILPFKKMKRDDSGLMGDLFGWAGIAANDDDFTIPGFFKQKM